MIVIYFALVISILKTGDQSHARIASKRGKTSQ
jgi:hypothetical protein